jgi:hypothetical protein
MTILILNLLKVKLFFVLKEMVFNQQIQPSKLVVSKNEQSLILLLNVLSMFMS